jgi:hypothetical protein
MRLRTTLAFDDAARGRDTLTSRLLLEDVGNNDDSRRRGDAVVEQACGWAGFNTDCEPGWACAEPRGM